MRNSASIKAEFLVLSEASQRDLIGAEYWRFLGVSLTLDEGEFALV